MDVNHKLLEMASYQHFLDNIFEETNENVHVDDFIRKKTLNYPHFLTKEEVEGECIGWSQEYLDSIGCPSTLSTHISHSAYEDIHTQDVNKFIAEDEEDQVVGDRESHEDKTTFFDHRKLLKEVILTVHKICYQWKKQLPQIQFNNSSHEVCVHAIKNTRRKMEDVHVICPDLNSLFDLQECPRYAYYSIFDGHGGPEAAMYAGNHLHINLIHQHNFFTNPASALQQAYKQTDKTFLLKAKKENLRSGTTGVSILIHGSTLHIAWLGDSQAVLVKNGQVVSIMDPHKPDREDEKARIESLGGVVVWYGAWRVNGAIAVARAIGDKDYKPFVSSDADVHSCHLDGDEDYIVLACDGLWDVVSSKDIPELVYGHVTKHGGNKSQVAHKIVEVAKESGSSDNISVIVIFFKEQISVPK